MTDSKQAAAAAAGPSCSGEAAVSVRERAAGAALARFGLIGKHCLITGATKGIGRAIADELCSLGAQVRVAYMRQSGGRRLLCVPSSSS